MIAARTIRSRRRGYVLLETVVATGILVVGLAVLGAQVQDADSSIWEMRRKIRAIMLAEQQLAKLDMGLVELESVDEIEEGDFGPRHPDFGWQLITQKTAIEQMYLLRLDVLFHRRNERYQEDDFEFDRAELVHSVYAMRVAPQPVHFGEDFGLNEEEIIDLGEKFSALGIRGLDVNGFYLDFLRGADYEELIKSLPLILDALHIDLSDLISILPPDVLQQIKESGLLDQMGPGGDSQGPGSGGT